MLSLIEDFCGTIGTSVDSTIAAMNGLTGVNSEIDNLTITLQTINGYLNENGKAAFHINNVNEINKSHVKTILNGNIPEFNEEHINGHTHDAEIKQFINDLKDVKDQINKINEFPDNPIESLKKIAKNFIYKPLNLNVANIDNYSTIFQNGNANSIFGATKNPQGNDDYYIGLPDDNTKKVFYRKVAYKIINELGLYNPPAGDNPVNNIDELSNNQTWVNFVNGIRVGDGEAGEDKFLPIKKTIDKLSQGFFNFSTYGLSLNGFTCGAIGRLLNLDGVSGPTAPWNVASKGKVLISNSADTTMNLKDDSSGWESLDNANIDNIQTTLKSDKFISQAALNNLQNPQVVINNANH
ncbi:MAG: hypothetical protein MR717_06900 [Prevotella sp.]|nr:hypothetical protein [Prevotella sp.]